MNNEQIGSVSHEELMDIKELTVGTFENYWGRVDRALEGLTSADLAWRPQAECNPIGFIAWHMARVEDRFIHYFARGMEEVWVRNNWWTRFGLDAADHGVHYTLAQVAAFPVLAPEMLFGYLEDVRRDTQAFLQEFQLQDLHVGSGRFPFPPNIPAGADQWPMGHMFRQLFGELNQHLGMEYTFSGGYAKTPRIENDALLPEGMFSRACSAWYTLHLPKRFSRKAASSIALLPCPQGKEVRTT